MADKFEFRDLSSGSVARTLKSNELVDDKIRSAVIEHLTNVVLEDVQSQNTVNSESNISDTIIADAPYKKAIYSEADLERIKQEAYEKGRSDCRNEIIPAYEAKIKVFEEDNNFLESLKNEILKISSVEEPFDKYIDIVAEIIQDISDRLILEAGPDFKKVVTNQLDQILKMSYQGGKVTISVNEKRQSLMRQILENPEVSSKVNDVEIIPDSRLSDSNCVMTYNQTKLVYDKTLVKNEIDEIIKQFKQD